VHNEAFYAAVVDRVTGWLAQNFKGKRLIYRTTNPGHEDCMSFGGPVQGGPHVWAYEREGRMFTWDMFAAFNDYAVPRFKVRGCAGVAEARALGMRVRGAVYTAVG
jgi:hypothetical protein